MRRAGQSEHASGECTPARQRFHDPAVIAVAAVIGRACPLVSTLAIGELSIMMYEFSRSLRPHPWSLKRCLIRTEIRTPLLHSMGRTHTRTSSCTLTPRVACLSSHRQADRLRDDHRLAEVMLARHRQAVIVRPAVGPHDALGRRTRDARQASGAPAAAPVALAVLELQEVGKLEVEVVPEPALESGTDGGALEVAH